MATTLNNLPHKLENPVGGWSVYTYALTHIYTHTRVCVHHFPTNVHSLRADDHDNNAPMTRRHRANRQPRVSVTTTSTYLRAASNSADTGWSYPKKAAHSPAGNLLAHQRDRPRSRGMAWRGTSFRRLPRHDMSFRRSGRRRAYGGSCIKQEIIKRNAEKKTYMCDEVIYTSTRKATKLRVRHARYFVPGVPYAVSCRNAVLLYLVFAVILFRVLSYVESNTKAVRSRYMKIIE